MLFVAFASSSLAALTSTVDLSITRAQEATASRKTQGSGIKIVLDRNFIDKYANRATIKTDFRVDAVSKVHPAAKDGEVHIGGVAVEAKLAAVAELTNPDGPMVTKFRDLAKKSSVAARTVEIEGAWRIWCEHAGTSNQSQFESLPNRFKDSNPDHVFEVHPISKVESASLLGTFHPIAGFTPHDVTQAVFAYENVPCRIRVNGSQVTIVTKAVGFNFIEFVLQSSQAAPTSIDDGLVLLCQIRDTEGELVARRRRVVFVKGTEPEKKARNLHEDDRMHVIGIPRINLRLVKYRIENSQNENDPDDPLNWDLPYEILIVGEAGAGESQDEP